MTGAAWLQLVALVASRRGHPLLGPYLAGVFGDGERRPGDRVFSADRAARSTGSAGSTPTGSSAGATYAFSLLAFSPRVGAGRSTCSSGSRGRCRSTPPTSARCPQALSFNTAVSFVTNTNWQNYAGESTMSYLTQMAGLAVQNFVSAAVGLSVAVALIRGLARRRSATIGNFWVDLVRAPSASCCRWPSSSRSSWSARAWSRTCAAPRWPPPSRGHPVHPGGPFASQEAIKELGTNGGGTLNANSAHPFENPNGFTNLLQMLRSCSSRSPSPTPSGAWPRTRSRAGSCSPPCSCSGPGRSRWPSASRRAATEPSTTSGSTSPRRSPPTRRGGNMEGKEVRFGPGRLRPVRRHHHRHLDRRRQRRPRQLHPARRRGAAGNMMLGRGQPRRRGRRPLRHVDLRPARGVHRRPDGRAAPRSTSARRSRPPR